MATRPPPLSTAMSAIGLGNIQVAGDLILTIPTAESGQRAEEQTAGLSPEERAYLTKLTDEIVQAEGGLISTKTVRTLLNKYVDVNSVNEMTAEHYTRATLFLVGWRNCALGRELSNEASIAQVMRMWAAAPALRGITLEFTRNTFQRELLKNMTMWELRTTLAFTMAKWQTFWEGQARV